MSDKRENTTPGQNDGDTCRATSSQVNICRAVERIIASPDQIEALTRSITEVIRQSLPGDTSEELIRDSAEQKVISHYANRVAIIGGLTTLPAIFPGVGSVIALTGGALTDMTMCLKYEVEMILALLSLNGFDIHDPRERQLACLLAASHTYESTPGQGPIADLIKINADAIWNYSPREICKAMLAFSAGLALAYSGRTFTRAVPLVGQIASGSINKVLAYRLGKTALKAIKKRARPVAQPQAEAVADSVSTGESAKNASGAKRARATKGARPEVN